jgi:hypothetical protein
MAAAAPAQPSVPSAAPAPMPQHVAVHHAEPTPDMPALGVAIAARSLSGARQFDIRLDPPELGHVAVRLSIDAAGKASAHLTADQQQTLDLLQKDSGSLTRALRDAGLDVSQNGLNFSLRQQNGGGDHRGFSSRGHRGALAPLSGATRLSATLTSTPNPRAALLAADGRVDIKV